MSQVQLRASQLLTTFGPGAMMDLPEGSVIVGGLDHWRYDLNKALPIVTEARLTEKLRQRFNCPTLTLRRPPTEADEPHGTQPAVTAWLFPRWFLVQKAEDTPQGTRRRLVPQSRLERGRFRDGPNRHEVVPVRFVRACERGHVDDIDWPAFVHGVPGGCGGELFLEERSTTGELVDVWVVCTCGRSRSLAQAARKGSKALGSCNGGRPWLGAFAKESCDQHSRLLIRSASNAYFPQNISVISIPERRSGLDDLVRSLWDDGLSAVNAVADLDFVRRIPNVAARLAGIQNTELIESIDRVRRGAQQTAGRPVKEVEFEAFSEAKDELGVDVPEGDFYARALPQPLWVADWMTPIRRVVLIHRLREVVAQVRFTRFESLNVDINGDLPDELNLQVEPAVLSREQDWLPAVENRGEGVFLLFDPAAIHDWTTRPAVIGRGRQLDQGMVAWRADHPRSQREFPGLPYYLLHTFAHLLMTSIALDCGYPASSLRERIYALRDTADAPGRYGVLIHTGSSDAEGTLGGLVAAARRIRDYVRHALDLARLCSNDPVCAHHRPVQHDHSLLLGAACHGCVLVPETSCEQRNEFLDRSLVVSTLEQAGAELFSTP